MKLSPDQVLQYFEIRLGQPLRRSGGEHQYAGRCPFHDDAHPSLSVNVRRGIWHCFAGCGSGTIVAFEMRLNSDERGAVEAIAELSGSPQRPLGLNRKAPTALYEYVDECGRLLYQKLRYDLPDGGKRFEYRKPNGHGGWIYRLDKWKDRRVLYRLPEVVTANEIIVTEGEKDCELVRGLNLQRLDTTGQSRVAVTTSGGVNSWRHEFAAYFCGKKAIIFADDDEPGRKHAEQVARSISQFTRNIKIVRVPAHDVGDYITEGHGAEDLLVAINATPTWQPETDPRRQIGIRLSDVRPETVKWLWIGRIPLGKLTVLEGDPGVGKSTLSLSIAAAVTRGSELPGGGVAPEGGVILISCEDGLADTVRPRLDAAGADVTKVVSLAEVQSEEGFSRPFSIESDLSVLERAIIQHQTRLVIIDPLTAFLSSKIDSYRDSDVRRALAPLAALAEKTGAAVVVVRHHNKGSGLKAIYRGGGSIAFNAAARSVLCVAVDPNDKRRYVLASVKNNLSPRPASLLYRLVRAWNGHSRIEWLGESSYTADTLLATGRQSRTFSRHEEATMFLQEVLARGGRLKSEIDALAEQDGISQKTLQRASDALGIVKQPTGYQKPWRWSLPNSAEEGNADDTTGASD